MSSVIALEGQRGRLVDQITDLVALIAVNRREVNRLQGRLATTASPEARRTIESQIDQLTGVIRQQEIELARLNQELADLDAQIARAKNQQGSRESAGEVVQEQAQGRQDEASVTNPPTAPVGDAAVFTNADTFDPAGQQDSGTDDATRSASSIQSSPPATTRPGGPPPGAPSTRTIVGANPVADDAYPSGVPGAVAQQEDAVGGTGVRAKINSLYGGDNGLIIPQDNILDQYASYSYNISIYLMSPSDYRALLRNRSLPKGSQLLIQTAGAPPAGGSIRPIDAQEAAQAADGNSAAISQPNLGRNQFFPLDYYIDDVRIHHVISGKGSTAAHNSTKINFTLFEPNGITLIPNLVRAVQQYVKTQGASTGKVNYAAQNYLMAIRFYGYDDQGNIVTVGKKGINASGNTSTAIVEKYIPFMLTAVKFRVANKITEYSCEGACSWSSINLSRTRGVVPYNIELSSQRIQDLLIGKLGFAADNSQGRAISAPNQTAAGARNPNNAGYLNTNESGLGTNYTLGVGA